jgi:hypothetical protein
MKGLFDDGLLRTTPSQSYQMIVPHKMGAKDCVLLAIGFGIGQ